MCIRWLYRKLPHLECSGVKALALDLLSVALTLTLTLTLASGDVSMHHSYSAFKFSTVQLL